MGKTIKSHFNIYTDLCIGSMLNVKEKLGSYADIVTGSLQACYRHGYAVAKHFADDCYDDIIKDQVNPENKVPLDELVWNRFQYWLHMMERIN